MTRTAIALVLSLFAAGCGYHERPLFDPSPAAARAAGIASDAAVGAQIAIEAVRSARAEHPWRAFGCQGFRLGTAFGVGEGLKRAIRRTRPDGSDNGSTPSQHTAVAMSQGGWRVSYSFFIGAGVGVGRMGAKKHYPTDVVGGALLGLATQFLPWCGGE